MTASCGYSDLGCWIGWIQDEIKGFFVWISEQIFAGVVSILNSIPLPSWASGASDLFSSIPANVGYFIGPFNLGTGAAIIVSAYGVRFLIRRIPLIG